MSDDDLPDEPLFATVDMPQWPLDVYCAAEAGGRNLVVTKLELVVSADDPGTVTLTFDDGGTREYSVVPDSHVHLELAKLLPRNEAT